ncbi:MAG: hypothetical protein FWC20_08980 [Oscillospiraceae bacterium]|nr:hypothetical protein [Oscillospiraceae bacterium]MCL2279522.1 hypothetical protein [Oscillospiraceae bacterium]
MDDKYYMDMIVNYLKQWKKGQKKDFIELLRNKLPEILSSTQKENKVKYYLKVLSQDNIIEFVSGTSRTGVWVLGKTNN